MTSNIKRRKNEITTKKERKEETTVVKYKSFGIAMPCGLMMKENNRNVSLSHHCMTYQNDDVKHRLSGLAVATKCRRITNFFRDTPSSQLT